MPETEDVKIGFIGCGGNARGHIRSLQNVEGARIVAVCDFVEDLANSAAEECGAQAYTSHKIMLERDDLDAIWISIPVFAHGRPELDTIERGLPFLVEKPVGRDMETAKKIEEAVNSKGIMTCVGYQLRYCGSTEIAKKALDGQIIVMVAGKYWSGSGRGGPDRWSRQMAKSGGQLVEQATHTIDMMRYLVGEVREVYAKQASRILKDIDCPDVHCVTFEFENGVLGSLVTTWAYDPSDWSHANVLDIGYDQCLLNWTATKTTITRDGEAEDKTEPSRSIDQIFVDAIRSGDGSEILSPYSDAVKSLAVSLAALESAERGKAISL